MIRLAVCSTLILILTVLCQTLGLAQSRDRSTVDEKYIWKLEDICPSDQAWTDSKDKIAGQFDEVLAFKGKLADSASQLLACLQLNTSIDKELSRLYCYASMRSDQDTRESVYQGMKQMLRQLGTDYGSKASFIAPEIVAMDQAAIDRMIQEEPELEVYRMFLGNIQRTKAHRLSAPEEKILAEVGLLAGGPASINSIFSNAELPFPEITLSDGTIVRLDKSGYGRYRAVPNRADRKAVFAAFFGKFGEFSETFGAQLAAQMNKDMFYARARGYDSSLHRALDADNIPVEVYHSLVANVDKNIETFHRYLRLRQRMLGLKQLEYCDVYAPVVEKVKLEYTFEQAMELTIEAVAPLGQDYVDVVKRSFDERWIDVYPSPGKRAGAYCNGSCYDAHPYMLLNYNGQYNDVSTLAHEMGHAMHSYYSNKSRPYPTADYSTFVAEVASTLNEALLIHKMLETIEDDNVKLSLLMEYCDGVKGTVFRQTQFAEFELAMHQKAEAGEPLTGDSLTELYGKILKKYYGHDDGICRIDDAFCLEWAYIPHFYYNFYVYQYATSFTASTALSERILSREEGAVDRTLEFLSAGGSDYPVEILKRTGVDMLTSEPFDRTMAVMNRVMDQIEEILDRQGK